MLKPDKLPARKVTITNSRRTSRNHKKPEHPGHQIQVGWTRGNFQRTPWKQSDLQNQGTGREWLALCLIPSPVERVVLICICCAVF